jgi:hypothetical protein
MKRRMSGILALLVVLCALTAVVPAYAQFNNAQTANNRGRDDDDHNKKIGPTTGR